LGPDLTAKFTVTLDRGTPLTVTTQVTLCDVPTGLVSDAGVNVQAAGPWIDGLE
jgi:hypothetical protein